MERSPLTFCRTSPRNYGIAISNYPVSSKPVPHDFVTSNVAFGDGALNLKVDAFTGDSVHSAEIITTDKLKYASVRTVLKSSPVPGIVEGNFFYRQFLDHTPMDRGLRIDEACSERHPRN